MFSALSAVREQLLPIAEGRESALDAIAVQRLTSCYRDHIEKENSELLAISRRLLSHQDIVVLSEAMTARRSSKS
jgi:hemerythrin-like domain-containing protein